MTDINDLDALDAPSPTVQSKIDRVLQARKTSGIPIVREYDGVEFSFTFHPVLSIPALRVVSHVQKANEKANSDPMVQLELLVEFMDEMAFPDSALDIAHLMRAGIIGINEVASIQQEVVAAVAARPTTRSSSSADGSSPTGTSSTAAAPGLASTPLPSPSIVS